MEPQFFALDIPGRPIAKGRPRVTDHGTYTPEATKEAELNIQAALYSAGAKPFTGPLKVGLYFMFAVPRSPAARRKAVEAGETPYHMVRPDLDNLVKLVLDAANGILWQDDGQVVEIVTGKRYGHDAGTLISVQRLEGR